MVYQFSFQRTKHALSSRLTSDDEKPFRYLNSTSKQYANSRVNSREIAHAIGTSKQENKQTNSVALSPRANYTV
jgi:hypothetical protein